MRNVLVVLLAALVVATPLALAWSSTTAGGGGTCATVAWDGRTPSVRKGEPRDCDDTAGFAHAHDERVAGTPLGAGAERDVRVADHDGDGKPDVVARSADDVCCGDLDGDGDLDHAGLGLGGRSIPENSVEYRLYGPGAAHWGSAKDGAPLHAQDLDGDGVADVTVDDREMTTGADWDSRVANLSTTMTTAPGHKSVGEIDLRLQPTPDGPGAAVDDAFVLDGTRSQDDGDVRVGASTASVSGGDLDGDGAPDLAAGLCAAPGADGACAADATGSVVGGNVAVRAGRVELQT